MSLSVDGVWKAGLWATTVWADGVWFEGADVAISFGAGDDQREEEDEIIMAVIKGFIKRVT